MEGPAQTLDYMIAGYAVIFGLILVYVGSLWLRRRKLHHEQQRLENLVFRKRPLPSSLKGR